MFTTKAFAWVNTLPMCLWKSDCRTEKAEKEYNAKHQSQLLNYLKATGIKVGLLINFGEKKCEFQRRVK